MILDYELDNCFLLDENKPTLIMMIGLPGSGKSSFAQRFLKNNNVVIHSSDRMREEMFGDVNDQSHNNELFIALHRNIKRDLADGKSVVYDATNISKKRRKAFLDELKNISCYKTAALMMTPFEQCLTQNLNRDKEVPAQVIQRMYRNFSPPHYHEGFDYIAVVYNVGDELEYSYRYDSVLNLMRNFDQHNEHHTKLLLDHCQSAAQYLITPDVKDRCTDESLPEQIRNKETKRIMLLHFAAMLHDNGKLNTATAFNVKGEDDGNYHYYQHHCTGSYDSYFYLREKGLSETEINYIANIIYFHMEPYGSWKQFEKTRDKAIKLIGQEMFNDVMALHEADLAAH